MRIRRRTIAWTSAAIVIAAFVVIRNLPLRYLPYSKWTEIDIHSGHQREVRLVFGIPLSTHPKPTDFGMFADQHLEPLGPPEWRPAHLASPFNWSRINFRFAGISSDLQGLIMRFEIDEIPLPKQVPAARAALRCLKDGERFQAYEVNDSGDLMMFTYRRGQTVVYGWEMAMWQFIDW